MTTTLTKSQIFTYAWELARSFAQSEGTGPRAQFGRALKQIYASAKEMAALQADEAQRRVALANDLFEEIEEINTRLGKFGPRANAEKDRLRERRTALRAEYESLRA